MPRQKKQVTQKGYDTFIEVIAIDVPAEAIGRSEFKIKSSPISFPLQK